MAQRSEGERPARSRRALVSASEKPQSIMTRVRPLSTTSALPALPLPSEVKRITSLVALSGGNRPLQRRSRCQSSIRCPLLELLVEESEDLLAGRARLGAALGILHLHL